VRRRCIEIMGKIDTARSGRFLVAFLVLLLGISNLVQASEQPILVVGHKNPDTDSIASAIAVADLKSRTGHPAIPVAQGVPNPETALLLKKFNTVAPAVQKTFVNRKVILVDHSDYALAPDDIKDAEIVGLYDHHKLGGISTSGPIEAVVLPVGATATILWRQFLQEGLEIPSDVAGLMLGAILSDTRTFRSPTTTDLDRQAAHDLAKTAGVQDVNALGREMLGALNDRISAMSDLELIGSDFKSFDMSGTRVGISQIEVPDIEPLRPRLKSLETALWEMQRAQGARAIILMVTDVNKQGSLLLVASDSPDAIARAMDVNPANGGVWVEGLMSRKKQVVPRLERFFSSRH